MPRLKGRTGLDTGGAGAIGLAAARRNNHTTIWTGSEMPAVTNDWVEKLLALLKQTHSNDVSAVIETPSGFLLYVAKEKTAAVLSMATLSLPKRNYEQWLAEQPNKQP